MKFSLSCQRVGADDRLGLAVHAGAVAELVFGRLGQRQVQQPQVDAGRAGPRALVAADAAAARWNARVMCQAKLPLSVAEVSMHCGPVLVDDAPLAVAQRADLPAGVALHAAAELGRPVGHAARRAISA